MTCPSINLLRRLYIQGFLLIFWSLQVHGQHKAYRQFTVEDGLASNVVYDVVSDESGVLWFATNSGVSRYDGYEFVNYYQENGLADIENFEFRKDGFNRIWLMGYSNQLSTIQNDVIAPYQFNHYLVSRLSKRSLPVDLFVDQSNIFYSTKTGIFLIDDNGEISPHSFNNYRSNEYSLIDLGGDNLFREFPGKVDLNQRPFRIRVIFDSSDRYFNDHYNRPGRQSARLNANCWVVQKNLKDIFCICKDTSYSFYEGNSDILRLKRIGNSLFIGTRNGFLELTLNNNELSEVSDVLFRNYSITGIEEDFQGGIWITTLFNGVFYFPNNGLKFLVSNSSANMEPITCIEGNNSSILAGGKSGKIYSWREGSGLVNVPYYTNQKQVKDIIADSDGGYYFSSYGDQVFYLNTHGEVINFSPLGFSKFILPRVSFNELDFFNDSIFAYGPGGVFLLGSSQYPYLTKFKNIDSVKVLDFIITEKGDFLIASLEGVLICKSGSDEILWLFEYVQKLKGRINKIEKVFDNYYIFFTSHYGPVMLKYGNWRELPLQLESKYKNATSAETFDDILLIGGNWGVDLFRFDTSGIQLPFARIDHNNGLLGNQVLDLKVQEQMLFIGTRKGVCVVDLKKYLSLTQPPKVFWKKVNGFPFSEGTKYEFPFSQNRLELSFDCLDFRNSRSLSFFYAIPKLFSDTLQLLSNNVSLANLKAGKYDLYLFVNGKIDNENLVKLQFSFSISPPFWQTWWFYLLEFLLLSGLILSIIQWRGRVLRERTIKAEFAKREKLDLEIRALRNLINPHFLFNTLNSIQAFVIDKDSVSAAKYLSSFSRLVRRTFGQAREASVTLAEEEKYLDEYIGLEQLRFDFGFSYSVKLKNIDEPEMIRMPSMLVQPFVENSILHGVANLEEKGKIEIEFELINQTLKCTIQDNGIGRKAASRLKKGPVESHKSLGTSITFKRLEMYNNRRGTVPYKVIDLEENGKPLGTRVELYIDVL